MLPHSIDSAPENPADQAGIPERIRGWAGKVARRLSRSRLFWAVAAFTMVVGFAWERCGIVGCPNVSKLVSYQPGGAPILIDRNGNRFANLGPVDHSVVELSSLPKYVPAAFVAVEDKRFYKHDGVDWRRVVGAAVANVKAGRSAQGSSTITMQLTRNLFPDRIRAADRTFRRKLLEVRVSGDIEGRFSKQEILELYLNHIYFGSGAYGIEAAARQYFGRPAKSLTVEQAALLAALPKAPNNYDPRRNPGRARSRRNMILGLMVEQGLLSVERGERAKDQPVRVRPARSVPDKVSSATWFIQAVREQLEEKFGEDLYGRPLKVYTTVDLDAQRAAEEEVEAQVRQVEEGAYGRLNGPRMSGYTAGSEQTDYLQAAAVVMDNLTGDVRALVGGRNIRHSSFNRATVAKRQAGSAFKPFVYATALAEGWTADEMLDDSPYRLAGGAAGGKAWEPNNYDGEFYGPMTLRDALVYSRNVPTIRLAGQVGERKIIKLARAAGIQASLRESPVIALGTAEVSPLELVSAYTTFAGQGTAVEPRLVLRVEDEKGKVLWKPEVRSRRVLSPEVASLMTELLREVVDRGTGTNVRYAGYGGAAAGKTGTTNDGADNWFVGYTPRLTAGIWIGFDKPRQIAPHASGAVAAYAWGRMIDRISGWSQNPWGDGEDFGGAVASTEGDDESETDQECVRESTYSEYGSSTRCLPVATEAPAWLSRARTWAGGLFRRAPVDPDQESEITGQEPEISEQGWVIPRDRWQREQYGDRRIVVDMPRGRGALRHQQQVLERLRGAAETLRGQLDDQDVEALNALIEMALRSLQETRKQRLGHD